VEHTHRASLSVALTPLSTLSSLPRASQPSDQVPLQTVPTLLFVVGLGCKQRLLMRCLCSSLRPNEWWEQDALCRPRSSLSAGPTLLSTQSILPRASQRSKKVSLQTVPTIHSIASLAVHSACRCVCMLKSAAERMVGSGCIVQAPVAIVGCAHYSFDSRDKNAVSARAARTILSSFCSIVRTACRCGAYMRVC
jgi:hypothetical protein